MIGKMKCFFVDSILIIITTLIVTSLLSASNILGDGRSNVFKWMVIPKGISNPVISLMVLYSTVKVACFLKACIKEKLKH